MKLEIIQPQYQIKVSSVGVAGVNGTSGTTGTSGTSGVSGENGSSGTSGTSGINGLNGTNGIDGTSGVNGSEGTSGTSGVSGENGTSGTSGTSGVNGENGTSGTSGTSGSSGISGTSGVNGETGSSGTSGINGIEGTSGTSGVNGTSGTSGISGENGTSGTSGDITLFNTFTGSIQSEVAGIQSYTASLKSVALVSGSLIASSSYSVVSDGARTIDVYSAGIDFESYPLFSNAIATNGVAISGDTNLRYNSSTNVLTIPTISATKYLGGIVSGSAQLIELNVYTGSNDSVVSRILQTTASLNTLTGSVSNIVSGLMGYTASLKSAAIVSSSTQIQNYFLFAQTSSANTFYNNQTISGSLFVSSTAISNATLLASSSNLTLNSGSNLYINNGGLASISGSVIVTGSLIVSASTNLTGSVTINGSRIDNGWTAYTPQWTAASSNPVINNGTIEGYYKVIGKTCFVRGNIAMGSTTTFGSGEWYVSMPFTASHADAILMSATLLDNGSAWYNAILNGARAGFNHKSAIQYQVVGGTADSITPTGPFTWATGDRFIWNGSYEIA